MPDAARNRAKGRTNITLEPDVAAVLKAHLDALEAKHGFRPTAHQVVSGLIRSLAVRTELRKDAGDE